MKAQGKRARTKIVCTLGPATRSYEKIIELIDAGMDVVRINMSHGTHEEHFNTIENVKNARENRGVPLPIMLDTKGPEVRVGPIKEGEISLKEGQSLKIVEKPAGEEIAFMPFTVVQDIEVGMRILFDDGYITAQVVEKHSNFLVINVQAPGVLKSYKGVNIPQAHLHLPAVTEQDRADIIFGCKNDMDILAASFIRSAEHILTIKALLEKYGASDVLVLAKIESALGVKNFDSILQVSDGIMVARGDLGVELPVTHVPQLQKMMIRKSYQSCKSVVTATQMLESMIVHPRPTRAEVSDVANAIYDNTSAVMLSGETASGKYPIESVKIMKETILETEKAFDYEKFFYTSLMHRRGFNDISSSVALAAVETAYSAKGAVLFALTTRGSTARIMARSRPQMPIIAVTSNKKTYHQLGFCWGTIPIYEQIKDVKEGVRKASCYVLTHKLARYGDLVVITSGTPFGVSGTTNMMVVDSIGEVLVRGMPGKGKRIHGKVVILLTVDVQKKMVCETKNKIVVLPHWEKAFEPYLQGVIGIVLQNHPDDSYSEEEVEKIAHKLQVPLLVRADEACTVLKRDQMITLDPLRGLVFDGIIDCEEAMLSQFCRVPRSENH